MQVHKMLATIPVVIVIGKAVLESGIHGIHTRN
jgi:hypothetical protein